MMSVMKHEDSREENNKKSGTGVEERSESERNHVNFYNRRMEENKGW